MEFENEFTVPTDIETAWATLTDLEKVAPCLPGATLEEVEGDDTYHGRVKVKVGPITVTYKGTARFVEADADRKVGRIEASGKETRGSGTAKADVTASLTETGEGTLVKVATDLNVTGRPAQFGRGVMGEVGTKIIGSFAERLEELVLSDDAAGKVTAEAEAAGARGEQPDVHAGADEGAPAEAAEAEAVGVGAGADEGAPAEAAETEAAGVGAGAGTDAGAQGAGSGAGGGEAQATGAAAAGAAERRRIAPDPSREDDVLDLMDVAGASAAKRLIPLVVGAAIAALIVWLIRRR